MYVKNDIVRYFDSFGVEHISSEIKEFIGNKIINANIYRIQAYYSITCVHFCRGFNNFMLNNKKLEDFSNFFLPKK